MLRIFAVLIVLLAVATVPATAQVADDAAAWFHGATCPATWVTLTPPVTLPAQPDLYRVRRPTGGPTLTLTRAAVEIAWTVSGVLDTAALDAALADGSVVSLAPGRAAQILCSWRPLGGTP